MPAKTIKTFNSLPLPWPPSYYDNVLQGQSYCAMGGGTMVTFNHDLGLLGTGDQGGPWLAEQSIYKYSFGHHQEADPTKGYRGPTLPWPDIGIGLPGFGGAPDDSYYWQFGAKAIEATDPSSPIFSATTFLGETLQDGLPKMAGHETWKEQTFQAKQAGGEYLNYQFGWVPFVSDLRSFGKAVGTSSKVVSTIRRQADLKIRRHLDMRHESTYDTAQADSFIATPGSWSIGSTPTFATSSFIEDMWFDGCYRWYIPMDDSMVSRFKRYRAYARRLYGIELTPEAVWNIAPWSWAVDWAADVGTILHNQSALGHNGLVLQYGYVMHHQRSELAIHAPEIGAWRSSSLSRKRRVPANPYGFGVSSDGLSAQQVAVLAALGLTRSDAIKISG